MRYIFYADVYFIQNFIIKIAVLYLSLFFNKNHAEIDSLKGIGKLCVVSFVGTTLEIIGLLTVKNYNWFLILVHLVEIPLMFIVLFRRKEAQILKPIAFGYFFIMIINGILEILWNQFGEEGDYWFYLLFSCGAVIIGARIWRNYKQMQKGVFDVRILHQGRSLQAKGFYDSGNRLKDVYTQKGIHIISAELLEEVSIENPVYVPYQSLGNEEGVLEVYYIDELVIWGKKQTLNIEKCPVGVTKDNLFKEKKYQIILNEEVF